MSTLLKVATLGFCLLLAPQLATAALFAPPAFAPAGGSTPDQNIASLSGALSLELTIDSATTGETGLTYNLALNDDPTATWTVVDFAIIRDWSEGAASNLVMPADWSGSVSDHFIDWSGDATSALTEGGTKSFGYTVAGGVPSTQLFVYYVTKNGGTPFQVIDSAVPLLSSAQVVVPEPTAFALVGGVGLCLWGLRRGTRRC